MVLYKIIKKCIIPFAIW